jgi:hypothetical protein
MNLTHTRERILKQSGQVLAITELLDVWRNSGKGFEMIIPFVRQLFSWGGKK